MFTCFYTRVWVVVAILTINRCVDPSSKSQVASWFQQTALPFILNIDPSQINPSRIFRELTIIEKLKTENLVKFEATRAELKLIK